MKQEGVARHSHWRIELGPTILMAGFFDGKSSIGG
jgi:hypothetical protein